MSPLSLYQAPSQQGSTAPLTPGYLEIGGVVDLYQKRFDTGDLQRLASVDDVKSGLRLKSSLLSLSELTFAIPRDRFSPNLSDRLLEEHDIWLAARALPDSQASPYGKHLDGSLYLFYSTEALERRFRINTLGFDESDNLVGQALDAAVELSDYLTQYVPGRSTYAGSRPSVVAEKNLSGRQNLPVTNRRFVRDVMPEMTLLRGVPDQRPSTTGVTHYQIIPQTQPVPYNELLVPTNPRDIDAFTGRPSQVISPAGAAQPYTGNGTVFVASYNDLPTGITSASASAPLYFGTFRTLNQINTAFSATTFATSVASTTYPNYRSHLIWGCIVATSTGEHSFKLVSSPGHRVNFNSTWVSGVQNSGAPIGMLSTTSKTTLWTAYLTAGRHYPFMITWSTAGQTGQALGDFMTTYVLNLTWAIPASPTTFTAIPNANVYHNGGFDTPTLVRFVDAGGVTRFHQAAKTYDGTAMRLGFPADPIFPPSADPNGTWWPNAIPAGTVIEEIEDLQLGPKAKTAMWGTGWSRSTIASFSWMTAPGPGYVQMQSRSTEHGQDWEQ